MQAIALLYHDVIPARDFASSGFGGGDADRYKLDRLEFEAHLEAIAEAAGSRSLAVETLPARRSPALLLTFDDGGAAAFPLTADLLERYGWRGHFFIPTAYVGARGFLGRDEIVGLKRRGHLVGTHSHSHPPRMSRLPRAALADEWRRSVEALAEVVGEPVTVASVPGGYYSRQVAEAAAQAGIGDLFTSEPVTAVSEVAGCRVYGRFSMQRGDAPGEAAALVAGRRAARLGRFLFWNAKKGLKVVGGDYWLRARRALLNGR